ncbi:MAG: nucleic acid/nucleotide deaminase domain-containing protein [Thermoactinomyces vulgaris]|jgi:hypothetical protein|uniref:nucleic acid/nucleotide deaminase domain-containing protein n=1 Tax=Thermoactinomyces sp. CICC 23799 TaxID=2767429 RepID=UPI0018DDE71F|nr:nucleic acid/nucleotide deaminase domain-containing protein [Thermoactinomyces sp. CICC 23799]MBH8602105.1 hypothetical protein [Thermoactinomyces sp. CICC 23799]
MAKRLIQYLLISLMALSGIGFWHQGVVLADGIQVPTVNDEFDQFEQKEPIQQEQPVSSPPVDEQKGIVDQITEPLSEIVDWLGDKISGSWEWLKAKAAAFWDWLTEICSKMAEVVVDALSTVWEWVKKYKEYIACAVVLVIGIVLCFFPLTSGLGASILWGMGISFLVSAGLNGGINKDTFMEAAIGGVLGVLGFGIAGGLAKGLASGIGQKLIMGLKNTPGLGAVLRGGQQLLPKLPGPFQKMFSRTGLIGAVEGAGTSVADDILHNRNINVLNAIMAGVFGAGAVAVVHFATPAVNKAFTSLEPILGKTPIVKNIIMKVDGCVGNRTSAGYLASIEIPGSCLKVLDSKTIPDEMRSPHVNLTGKIQYGESDLSQIVQAYRKKNNLSSGRNVAVFEYIQNGEYKIIIKESGYGHSERKIARELEQEGIHPEQVTRIYSELEPCVIPGGMCQPFIDKNFPNAKVTYSFEYGNTRESRRKGVNELKKSVKEIMK